jgi:hypothetical protein
VIVLLRLGCGILGVSVALLAVCDPPRVTVGNRSSVGDLVVVSVRRPLKERLSVNLGVNVVVGTIVGLWRNVVDGVGVGLREADGCRDHDCVRALTTVWERVDIRVTVSGLRGLSVFSAGAVSVSVAVGTRECVRV